MLRLGLLYDGVEKAKKAAELEDSDVNLLYKSFEVLQKRLFQFFDFTQKIPRKLFDSEEILEKLEDKLNGLSVPELSDLPAAVSDPRDIPQE